MIEEVGKRFSDKKIGKHWQVDESKDSFNKAVKSLRNCYYKI